MTTLAEANIASDYETWASYWSQCRITLCVYEFPIEDTSMDNPLIVRWREIPEGENVDEPHPEIEVQQLVAPMGTECIRALLDVMPDDHPYKTVEGIEKASMSWHEDQLQRVKDFEEYLEYRANGNIKVETIDETQPITWESIRNASTEELFQTKLEIFESPPVQECENKDWRQNVKNQSLSFINEGLKDRAITRDLSWGVDIPVDGWEEKKIYVWFEAVLGYLSATVELFKNTKNPEMWKEFWEDQNSESYYFQGKDNIPFHAIILPAILLGVENKNLPTEVVANEYLNFSGKEFSKSRNWAVWLPDFLEKYSPDSLRYYLTSIMPETSDSDFTWEGYVASNNNELVATLGNFIHRVLTMSHRNFDGEVPYFDKNSSSTKEIIEKSEKALDEVGESISKRKFRESLNKLMNLARFGNQYLDRNEPWKKIKEDKESAGEILGQSMIIISAISSMLEPFLPNSAETLQKVIFNDKKNNWKLILPISGNKFQEPTPLFEKLEEEKVLEENGMISDE